jgi:hypothetical protein
MKPAIAEILKKHTDSLMALPGGVGTAEGRYEEVPCVTVLVIELSDDLLGQLPNELEGYRVVVSESGEIKAL